ncbi:hypothetical protein SAY86_028362 [Trapa natans]|uniref:BTB domain-containing protein n=1 Tax=Trapa natans TaxID=22666 RepID=A0AAN7RDW9_TRANT|nr:hypothetical protein SAY86_028362 [Trapa natans]
MDELSTIQHNLFSTMRCVNIVDGCKGPQIYALNSETTASIYSMGEKLFQHLQDHLRSNSIISKSTRSYEPPPAQSPHLLAETLLSCGLPGSDHLEPQIEPCLKSIDFVETLAAAYRHVESCPPFEKSGAYLKQCAFFMGFPDPKMFRRSLRSARQHAVDVHTKVVLSSWLRFQRREDELIGTSSMDCCGRNIECPRANLVAGYNPEMAYASCMCSRPPMEDDEEYDVTMGNAEFSTSEEYDIHNDMSFCIGDEEVRCTRFKIAAWSRPFKAMLYGDFRESRREKINFSHNGVSVNAMKAAEIFSRTRRLAAFDPSTVLELLSFANRFCCVEMKSACDSYLATLVATLEDAMILIEYGLAETAYLLVAACLQVILRELPWSMQSPNVMRFFCSPEAREKLAAAGHSSFTLYYLLSHILMENDVRSNMTVMLLERLMECAEDPWQKQLAYHQLGVVMMEREEYKDAQHWFEAAVEAGHLYSLTGVARAKYKRGHKYSAFKLMNSLISDHPPAAAGWTYQERSVYCVGHEKMADLEAATSLDPTLLYPYKYRSVMMLEEGNIGAAISEINKIVGFMASSDCLELRAWFPIALEDYDAALRDIRAMLWLEPNYKIFHGRLHGDQLLEPHAQQWSQADCWMQLYERWSSVDDIGSLAVVHHMVEKDPGKSLLRFRQSLLLLRLNCQKTAMHCLRLARNYSDFEHERLVYEGWILYDTGHRDEALAKAEESISHSRLTSSRHSDLDTSASCVIQLLEEALRCPSDGLRKGQALNNLGIIYVDSEKLDKAADCYTNALNIKHTRAHQGLARVYHLKNQTKAAYDEMSKLIEKAQNNASAYEKRSEYCDRDMAKSDLNIATQLDPLRTYPYRYRAAVLMDDHKEAEAIAELTRAIAFKPDMQLLYLRAAFYDSMGDLASTVRDCEAVLCLEPEHNQALELRRMSQGQTNFRYSAAVRCNPSTVTLSQFTDQIRHLSCSELAVSLGRLIGRGGGGGEEAGKKKKPSSRLGVVI